MKIAYNPIGGAVLTVSPPENDITFDLPGLAIWAKGVRFGKYETFLKHTSTSGGGRDGLVPAPNYTATAVRFLREDGTWIVPTNTTYDVVSNTTNGLAPKVINTNTSTITNAYYILASSNGSATPSWYKLPANAFANDDTKVTQTNSSENTSYRVLLSGNANDNTETTTARKSGKLLFNPNTGALTATSFIGKTSWSTIDGKPTTFKPESHYHKELEIDYSNMNNDARSASTYPSDYKSKFKLVGIKTPEAIGLTSTEVGSFVTLLGWKGYGDNSGPHSWELASTNKERILVRSGIGMSSSGTGNEDWKEWKTLAYTNDNFLSTQIKIDSNYKKAEEALSIAVNDSANDALGKLEYKTDIAYDFIVNTMSNTDDSNTTIDRLKEVFDVLKDLNETDVISSLINKYLPLTGGTMTGDVVWTNGTGHNTVLPGHIYRTFYTKTEATETTKAKGEIYDHYYPRNPLATSYANLRVWDASNNSYKTLRFGGDGTFTWNGKTILHSGNSYINNNTITINGTSLSPLVVSGTATQIIKGNGSYEEDSLYFKYRNSILPNVNADDLNLNGLYLNTTGNNKDETKPNINFPTTYGYLINFYGNIEDYSGFQLHANRINYLYRAKFDGSWSDWRILLDSNNYSNYLPFLNSTTTHATNASKIYAPTSGGTAGLVLKSNGNAAPTWVNSTTLTAGSITHTSIGTNDNKYYLLGSSSQNSSVTVNSHSNVYIQGGELHANNVWGIHSRTSNLQLDTTWNHSKIAFGPTASTTANYDVEVFDGEGSYVVQLSNGSGIWTGYFSIRHTSNPGSTTTIADEIVLQGGDSNTYERPYLRTLNMGNNIISLQIAYSTTLNDSSDWIFSFKRLI